MERDNDHCTLIEATPDGWFYTSQVPTPSPEYTTARVVAFHTHPNHLAAKRARRLDGFMKLVQSSTTYTSSLLQKSQYELSSSGAFPVCTTAGTSYLDKPYDMEERWIAVGDAAMAFDPLSSQGMMTALEMGYCVGTLLGARLLHAADKYTGGDVDVADVYVREAMGLEQVFQSVRDEYQQHRAYYYTLGKMRFPYEPFWDSV